MQKFVIIIILAFGLLACEDPVRVDDNIVADVAGIDLTFTTIIQDQQTFQQNSETRFLVFRNKTEQDEFFGNSTSGLTPFEVDYSKYMVIGIAMKPQPTGSNVINIDSLKLEDNKIAVYSSFTIAGIGTSVIGHPVHFIKLKKYDNLVEFKTINIIETPMNFSLVDTEWQLSKFIADGKEYTEQNADDYFGDDVNFDEATLNFGQNNNFNGWAFCNQMVDGKYNTNSSGNSLSLEFAATEVACAGSSEFQDGLYQTYSYSASENTLVLYSNSEIGTLYFSPKSDAHSPQINLENTKWKLIYWVDFNGNERRDVNGAYNFGPQVDKLDNLLFFDENGKFSTLQFTQWMEGSYEISSNSIDFDISESYGDESDFSQLYRETIQSSLNFQATEDSLTINTKSGIVKQIVFARYEYSEETRGELYGDWRLSHVINPQSEETKITPNIDNLDSDITIEFNSDGTLTGDALCNEYFGDFIHGSSSLITKPLAATKVYCPPSNEYIDAFGKSRGFEIEGDLLRIYTKSEDFEILVFKRD